MRVTWVQPQDMLAHELRQSADEGRDVATIAARWTAAGGSATPPYGGASETTVTPRLRALAGLLLDELAALPVDPQRAAAEPDDLGAILAAAPPTPHLPHLDRAVLADRILGGWQGRAAGCLLGKPVEKTPRAGIRDILEATGRWPLADYFTAVGLPEDVARRWPWNEASRTTSLVENIDGMPEDDDLNYPLLALLLLEQYGPDFTTDDVAQLWLSHLSGGRVFTAERAAYRNLLDGISPPDTATVRNPYREWIGAQIRGDLYGWVRPGDPRAAAALAWRDARLSHTRNGIYGAMYAAALVSAACVADDMHTVLDAGLSVVPAGSRFAEAVHVARDLAAHGTDFEDCVDGVYERYGELHRIHVLNNAALLTAALAACRGDYSATICATVSGGWDTDSNGATVGSVAGTLLGAATLPPRWIDPLRDRLSTSLPGMNEIGFTELARRTLAQCPTRSAGRASAEFAAEPGEELPARPLVTVVGSANMDLVANCATLPRPGETVLGAALATVPGGKGANQAVAAARSGRAAVAFLGAVGRDGHGAQIRELLQADGVDTARLRETDEPTGAALITVDAAADNCIVVIPGANGTMDVLGTEDIRLLSRSSVVLAQLEIPVEGVRAAFIAAKATGARTILNAAPVRDLPDDLLAVTDLLLVNEIEAAVIAEAVGGRYQAAQSQAPQSQARQSQASQSQPAQSQDPDFPGERLLALVPAVALTLGARGVRYLARQGDWHRIDAPRTTAVDTTAAGDTFAGYLAAALAAGQETGEALRQACAAASLSVERPGATSSIPVASAVAERYAAAYSPPFDGEATP
jgi:ribokinase